MNDLRVLLLEVTQRCNAQCDHCGSRCDMSGEDALSGEEILSVLNDVKEHIGTDMMVNVTGGEPLLRKDLFDIMTGVSHMGFDWGMVTNGTLIHDEMLPKMKRSGLKTITVSVDGMKETHERLRHLPNSFDRIISNIRRLKEADFLDHLQVTFTANRENIGDFADLYDLLREVGVDSIRTSCVDPIGRAEENRELLLCKEDLEKFFQQIQELNERNEVPIVWGCCHFTGDKIKNRRFRCLAGKSVASVLYNGDIFVCPNVPRLPELVQGNIKTDSFSSVWKNRFAFFRQKRRHTYCAGCKYEKSCNGDSLHTWDFDRDGPRFCYQDIFDEQTGRYKDYLKVRYGNYSILEVRSTENADDIYMEPEAYQEMRAYFHMGRRNPMSLYEQQLGLVGFTIDANYVIKYVFPSFIHRVNGQEASFRRETLKHAEEETAIAVANFAKSDDRYDYIGNGLRFLGFAHSHPMQEELQYSEGDVYIHQRLLERYGDYIGILVNSEKDQIGAYYGEDIRQGNLKLIEINSKKIHTRL